MRKGTQHKRHYKKQRQPALKVQVKHKDRLFRRIFEDKRDLLELYNAIRGTDYQNPDDLEITTIENMFFMGVKNDLSFLIDNVMNLYEHQSTVNPNMPLRGVEYFARLYKIYIKKVKANIYGSKRIALPFPQYIIFYNGTEEQPERSVLRLSDSFVTAGIAKGETAEPSLECTAVMLNINAGKNRELLEKCRKLWEYTEFTKCVRRTANGRKMTKEIMAEAVDKCIEKHILEDTLTKYREEVVDMFNDYSWEAHLKGERQIGFEEGIRQGRKRTIEQVMNVCQKLIKEGRTEELLHAASDSRYCEKLMRQYDMR